MTDHAAATSAKTQGLFKRLRARHLYESAGMRFVLRDVVPQD